MTHDHELSHWELLERWRGGPWKYEDQPPSRLIIYHIRFSPMVEICSGGTFFLLVAQVISQLSNDCLITFSPTTTIKSGSTNTLNQQACSSPNLLEVIRSSQGLARIYDPRKRGYLSMGDHRDCLQSPLRLNVWHASSGRSAQDCPQFLLIA